MSECMMLSIQPEWVAKILNGDKTIEVRKQFPSVFKTDKPFKVYIYCTQKSYLLSYPVSGSYKFFDTNNKADANSYKHYEGKVVGEFICDNVYTVKNDNGNFHCVEFPEKTNEIARDSCLGYVDMKRYCLLTSYAYHISDLKIYPEPIEIGRFTLTNGNQVIRPPQSYFYVKELVL